MFSFKLYNFNGKKVLQVLKVKKSGSNIYFWVIFFNIAKMPKKPFSLRSVQCTHIKYAKKMKKFDREVLPAPKSRKSVFSVRNSLSVYDFYLHV